MFRARNYEGVNERWYKKERKFDTKKRSVLGWSLIYRKCGEFIAHLPRGRVNARIKKINRSKHLSVQETIYCLHRSSAFGGYYWGAEGTLRQVTRVRNRFSRIEQNAEIVLKTSCQDFCLPLHRLYDVSFGIAVIRRHFFVGEEGTLLRRRRAPVSSAKRFLKAVFRHLAAFDLQVKLFHLLGRRIIRGRNSNMRFGHRTSPFK